MTQMDLGGHLGTSRLLWNNPSWYEQVGAVKSSVLFYIDRVRTTTNLSSYSFLSRHGLGTVYNTHLTLLIRVGEVALVMTYVLGLALICVRS